MPSARQNVRYLTPTHLAAHLGIRPGFAADLSSVPPVIPKEAESQLQVLDPRLDLTQWRGDRGQRYCTTLEHYGGHGTRKSCFDILQ